MPPSPPETRASLIVRLPDAADAAAWSEFVAIYSPLVFRMARKQGLQLADAEDLVQEVLSAVAKQVEGWLQREDRGKFRAWVLRIARNIAINMLTRRPHGGAGIGGSWHQKLDQVIDPLDDTASTFDIEFEREIYRWAAEQVQAAVADSTWQAFHLTHIEGMSIADVSKKTGLSEGAIYIARCRVMDRLRKVAKDLENSE